jgi:hypothetical protein
MAKFLNNIHSEDLGYCEGRLIRALEQPLIWVHEFKRLEIPIGFQSDGASVPRLPIIYDAWGDKVHREAFGHDYGYRTDAVMIIARDKKINLLCNWLLPEEYIVARIPIPKEEADWLIFRQTIKDHEHPKYGWGIYYPMYLAVRVGGDSSFHKKNVANSFDLEKED